MKSKKNFLTLISTLIVCALCISIGVYQQNVGKKYLSEEQIEELREDYPVYQLAYPPQFSGGFPTLDQLIGDADTFVYGEIIEDLEIYSKNVLTGIPAIDEKKERMGYSSEYTFGRYRLRVIEDTENIFKPGDEIILSFNSEFIDYNPELKNGMKIVYSAFQWENDPKQTSYMTVGTYYVTDDGYALSAFPEEQKIMQARGTYSGVKVEYLLKQLKKK